MKHIGEGIAFAALCGSAVFLEINGNYVSGLWLVIVLWAFFGFNAP